MNPQNDRIHQERPAGWLSCAIGRHIARQPDTQVQVITPGMSGVDLRHADSVAAFFHRQQPTHVILSLLDGPPNQQPPPPGAPPPWSEMLMGAMNVLELAHQTNVQRLVLIGDGLAYPASVPAPKGEEDWLTGRFRPDFEHEAIATAALIKLCASYTQDHGLRQSLPFRAILTATPFGGGFQARTQGQQVITIIMARLHEAREAQAPHVLLPFAPDERQEFVYTDDIAAAALYVLHMDDNLFASATAPARRFLNAGYGRAVSYGALAMTLAGIVGYRGTIGFSPSEHPTQQTTHWLDSHRLRDLGWRPLLDMEDALALTYLHHRATLKATDTAGAANPKAV